MFKINKCRVGTFLCPRGYQSAWADDKAVCPPYNYFENKFTLVPSPLHGEGEKPLHLGSFGLSRIFPIAKYRRADAHHGRTFSDGCGKVMRHAHRQGIQLQALVVQLLK